MAETIRVVIVDDELLFAELMRVALRAAEGIEVLAVVHDVKSAIAALNEHRPDVVIADYHLPDGTGADIARAVRNTLPDTSVLVLTADPSAVTLNDVARSGAVGHMTKGRGLTDVVDSVRAAASGEILFAPSELQRLLLESAASRKIIEPLTARELEVLRLLASGTSTTAAAESLGISTATLRAHVQAALDLIVQVARTGPERFSLTPPEVPRLCPSRRSSIPRSARRRSRRQLPPVVSELS